MPLMTPSLSDRNFTPTSSALPSPESTVDGTVAGGQIVHGQVTGCAVVKALVKVDASGLPATSVTRGLSEPPFTRSV
jgi:hypothetical protein